jgi:multicomponent Na+:H+ antiporter subunit D
LNLLALPILIPLIGASLCVLLLGRRRLQEAIGVLSGVASLGVSLWIAYSVWTNGPSMLASGGWAAPFGIVFVADRLSAIMLVLNWIVGAATIFYSLGGVPTRLARVGHYPLVLTLLAAVSGAFLTGDIFNLYVWFELMLISSFVLLTLGGRPDQLRGAVTYVTLNLVASTIFLAGAGIIYAMTGTLNMADLAGRLDALEPMTATLLGIPLLVAFSIKAALFPLYGWLPAAYHTPPSVVSALFAGLLTKVGVYALIRSSILMFDQELVLLGNAMIVLAGLTMVSGVLGAVAHNDMRRILSFHIVSQIGYMLMGLGIALRSMADPNSDPAIAQLALLGAVFYIAHHIVVKANLFLISGVVFKLRGTTDLSRLGGIARTNPVLAGLFFFSAMSLAGIPVLSGFWAKLALIKAGVAAGQTEIVVASLFVSLLTLFSMMKIWIKAFWGEPHPEQRRRAAPRSMRTMMPVVWCMAIISAVVAIAAPQLYEIARSTAEELLDSSRYIDLVLPPDREMWQPSLPQPDTSGGAL